MSHVAASKIFLGILFSSGQLPVLTLSERAQAAEKIENNLRLNLSKPYAK